MSTCKILLIKSKTSLPKYRGGSPLNCSVRGHLARVHLVVAGATASAAPWRRGTRTQKEHWYRSIFFVTPSLNGCFPNFYFFSFVHFSKTTFWDIQEGLVRNLEKFENLWLVDSQMSFLRFRSHFYAKDQNLSDLLIFCQKRRKGLSDLANN